MSSRYDEKCRFDAWQDKIAEERDRIYWAKRDYCEKDCPEHNENCPYYDADEETWDCEQCFSDEFMVW